MKHNRSVLAPFLFSLVWVVMLVAGCGSSEPQINTADLEKAWGKEGAAKFAEITAKIGGGTPLEIVAGKDGYIVEKGRWYTETEVMVQNKDTGEREKPFNMVIDSELLNSIFGPNRPIQFNLTQEQIKQLRAYFGSWGSILRPNGCKPGTPGCGKSGDKKSGNDRTWYVDGVKQDDSFFYVGIVAFGDGDGWSIWPVIGCSVLPSAHPASWALLAPLALGLGLIILRRRFS